MNRTLNITALTLCLLLTAATAWPQRYEREEMKKFDTSADPEVSIDSEFGVVRVKGHDKNTVKVKVTIQAKEDSDAAAKALADKVTVRFTGSGTRVGVAVDYPSEIKLDDDRALNIMVYMYAPEKSKLRIKNRFGNMEVMEITGSAKLEAKYGNVEVHNTANVNVDCKYGSVSLGSITGSCEVNSAMGNVIAFDVPGGTFKCAYGEMQITNGGTWDVSPGSSRSPGKATLDVASKGGDLRVISKMGNVTLNNVRSGSVDLSYGNAEVNLSKHFGGDVIAVTRFGSVDTDLDLEHSSSGGPGDTEEKLSGSVGSGSDRLIVKNKFGNIELRQE